MGFKTIVVFDNDHIDQMETNPEEFVKSLKLAILKSIHKSEVPVFHRGTYSASVANVVWCGLVDVTPNITFEDFSAKNINYKPI